MLNTYLTELQTLLHDFSGTLYGSPLSQTSLINRARNRVALQSQCIRILPSSSSGVILNSITNQGTGYTHATVTLSGPDVPNGVQATATVTVAGGHVTGFTFTNNGTGYINTPTGTISGNGTGATAIFQLQGSIVTTSQAQELYTFASLNAVIASDQTLGLYSGVSAVQSIFSVAVSQGTIKPVLRYMDFTSFQAYLRVYNQTQQDYPTIWSQYGQGQNGSFYLFPIPSGTYQMDVDCICQPIPLVTDSTAEAIPAPWQEPIPYYAAYLCFQYSQRYDDARTMLGEYNRLMLEGRAYSQGPEVPDVYEDDD